MTRLQKIEIQLDQLKQLFEKISRANNEYALDNYGQPVHKKLEESLTLIRQEYSALKALKENIEGE